MLDPAYANGRSDGQPPAKRRLVSLGDRSQSPATDIPGSSTTSLPRGAPAISRSSSSNTLVSDVNNLSFLSQSNSATGSPAPGGSPAPADFLAFFNTDTNTNPAEQTATPPTRNLSAPRPQQDDAETEYQRFKQTFPYETDARVRQAWEESGRQADKATTILCGSNPLLQGAAPSSNGSSAPSPVPPQSAPSGRPPSGQAGLNNSWNGMMPMGGSPPLQGHTGPPQYAQLPPQQQQRPQYPQGMHQQHPQSHMGGYPQQRPGFPHSGPPYMPSQGAPAMPAQSASSFYPGSQLYRGPAQGMPGQPAAAPRYPQPGQPPYRQAPGQPIVTLRQQPAIDPRAMIQQNLNPSNGAHVAQYRAMMGQAGRPGGGHMDGQMQRMQMLQANPNYTQQQRQQQEKAAQERNRAEHQARVHAHQQAMARTMQQNKASTHGKNDVSKTVAKFRPPAGAAAAAAAKRAKRKHADSDSEDGGNWSEGDNGAQYEEYVNVEKEAEAVQFLNTCRPEELPDYTACSAEAAQAIVQLRPFESPDDIRAKLKATKGISNKLFDSLVDVFEVCHLRVSARACANLLSWHRLTSR